MLRGYKAYSGLTLVAILTRGSAVDGGHSDFQPSGRHVSAAAVCVDHYGHCGCDDPLHDQWDRPDREFHGLQRADHPQQYYHDEGSRLQDRHDRQRRGHGTYTIRRRGESSSAKWQPEDQSVRCERQHDSLPDRRAQPGRRRWPSRSRAARRAAIATSTSGAARNRRVSPTITVPTSAAAMRP